MLAPLSNVLSNSSNPEDLKVYAAEVLGILGASESHDLLVQATLEEGSLDLASAATRALGEMGALSEREVWESLQSLADQRKAERERLKYRELQDQHGEEDEFIRQERGRTRFDLDLRTDEELRSEFRARKRLDEPLENLAVELCELLSTIRNKASQEEAKHSAGRRVVRIGQMLHAAGGMNRMRLLWYRVRCLGGDAGLLETGWDGVGDWRG